MIKKNKKMIIITSLIILIPLIAGIIMWNQLPDKMATHWNASGEVDGWSSKAFAVMGLPVFVLAIHLICVFATGADPKNQYVSKKMYSLVLWICPAVSLLCGFMTYGHALGYELKVNTIMPLFIGIIFIVIGNYMPKTTRNYTMGIKVPWTLNSDENWNKTHRFAGMLWVIGGVLVLLTCFLKSLILMPVITIVCAVLPMVYSYMYYRKHEKDSEE